MSSVPGFIPIGPRRDCDACGESYRPVSRFHRFCSPRCRWRGAVAHLQCAHCGKEFRPRRKGHRYCTKACSYRAYEQAHPEWRQRLRRIDRTVCPACGELKKMRRSAWCRACRNKHRSPLRSGEGACRFCGTTPGGLAWRVTSGRDAWCCYRAILASGVLERTVEDHWRAVEAFLREADDTQFGRWLGQAAGAAAAILSPVVQEARRAA